MKKLLLYSILYFVVVGLWLFDKAITALIMWYVVYRGYWFTK